MFEQPAAAIALLFVLKSLASIVSLGSGFRGGCSSPRCCSARSAGGCSPTRSTSLWPSLALDPHVYAIIGMGALSVSVIGGPLTMTFIALETTGDFWLTTAVLIAIIVSAQVTRETFGYSFATWRFHLRGETIRSAADVGWIRELTVRRMMRPDVRTVPAHTTISRFRMVFPLGSTAQVVAVDEDKNYAGIVWSPRRMRRSSTRPCRCATSCISGHRAAADHDGEGGGHVRPGRGRSAGGGRTRWTSATWSAC